MGAWGYFDDECDDVQEYLYFLEEEFGKVDIDNLELVNKIISKLKAEDNHTIAGVVMGLARETPFILPLPNASGKISSDTSTRGYPMPSLSNNYPKGFKKIGLKASENLLETIKDEDWKDPKLRKEALEIQIKLFTDK